MGLQPQENRMSEETAKAEVPESEGKVITVHGKYGSIDVNLNSAIVFPFGLLGMPSNTDFAITNFPKPNMDQFKLFQNLNDHELSFVVLPVSIDSELFDTADIEEACKINEISTDDLLMLSIISVQRSVEEIKVTANMRAPLLIDTNRKLGVQYVFPSNKYEIRHLLSQTKNN